MISSGSKFTFQVNWCFQLTEVKHSCAFARRMRLVAGFAMPVLMMLVFGLQVAKAQDGRKRKVPLVDKLSSGSSRQAFSGSIQHLDLKLHVLELNAKESKSLEIFPIKDNVSVSSAEGNRMKLTQLRPGNQVIIYYEQKGDKRTVKDIVLLTEGTAEKPKKPAPSS